MTPTVTIPKTQQQDVVWSAAQKYGISPQTLWGIYGAESGYGTNEGPSSQGALGPFQFLPSTGARYGLTSGPGDTGSIWNFTAAADAAANYLKNGLHANASPNSPQTIAALNGYNGNKGGTTMTAYAQQVIAAGGGTGGGLHVVPGGVAPPGSNVNFGQYGPLSYPDIGGISAGGLGGQALQASGAAGVWNSFLGWIPKAALTAGLVIAGLVLLVVAFGRTTGMNVSPRLP